MYAINENVKKINGVVVKTFNRDVICDQTLLAVEAGTTGYRSAACRGNSSRTFVSIECLNGDFHFSPILDDKCNTVGVEIACCGDDGLSAVLNSLAFAEKVLNDQRCRVED